MTPVRLEPAALRSRVKRSTTEPLHSFYSHFVLMKIVYKTDPFNQTVACDQCHSLLIASSNEKICFFPESDAFDKVSN